MGNEDLEENELPPEEVEQEADHEGESDNSSLGDLVSGVDVDKVKELAFEIAAKAVENVKEAIKNGETKDPTELLKDQIEVAAGFMDPNNVIQKTMEKVDEVNQSIAGASSEGLSETGRLNEAQALEGIKKVEDEVRGSESESTQLRESEIKTPSNTQADESSKERQSGGKQLSEKKRHDIKAGRLIYKKTGRVIGEQTKETSEKAVSHDRTQGGYQRPVGHETR